MRRTGRGVPSTPVHAASDDRSRELNKPQLRAQRHANALGRYWLSGSLRRKTGVLECSWNQGSLTQTSARERWTEVCMSPTDSERCLAFWCLPECSALRHERTAGILAAAELGAGTGRGRGGNCRLVREFFPERERIHGAVSRHVHGWPMYLSVGIEGRESDFSDFALESLARLLHLRRSGVGAWRCELVRWSWCLLVLSCC